MKITSLALAAVASLIAVAPAAMFAQVSTTTPAPVVSTSKPDTIQDRKENQQDRIAQGVKSGTLTAGETAKLEGQEAGLNKEEAGMRAQDNGKLTAQDRKTLIHQQNVESKRIYRTKHDGPKH